MYPNRYEHEPRKRRAYLDACAKIEIYGIERCHWNYLILGINRIEMKEVWANAQKDIKGESTYCISADYIPKRRRKK